MSTLYIDRRNLHMDIHGDALVFRENEQHINTIPLKLLERICIHGSLTLNARVLGRLGEESIGIVILNGRKQHPTLLMPNWKLDGKRRQNQYFYSQNPDFCITFAQNLIIKKIQKQQQLLQQLSQQQKESDIYSQIQSIQQVQQQISLATTLDQIRGLEGAASAQYFKAWQILLPPTYQFTGRNRRPPRDPINSLLSLGYTLLHFELVKYIQMCGLDPFIGFYHSIEHGRESLACDLIEPLRPKYDEWLLQQFEQRIFTPDDFNQSSNGCTLNKPARLEFYRRYEQLTKPWRIQMYEICQSLLKQLKCSDGISNNLYILENPKHQNETEMDIE